MREILQTVFVSGNNLTWLSYTVPRKTRRIFFISLNIQTYYGCCRES